MKMPHPPHAGPARARRFACLLAVAVAAACADSAVEPDSASVPEDGVGSLSAAAGHIIVLSPRANAAEVARQHGLRPKHVYTNVLNGFSGSIAEAARSGLLRDSRVVRVVPDVAVHTSQSQPNATWGLDRVDQRPLPLDRTYNFPFTGDGVTAYIFDTGIRFDHAEFEGRAVPGFDAIADGRDGDDCHGHGTHVAGTVGGRTYGVAKKVRLVAVRVMRCDGTGSLSGILAGIDWVMRNNSGPAVANFSIGTSRSETLNEAVRNLIHSGVQVSVAAGNTDTDACFRSPGSTLEAITVGASTSSDARASFSNWGSCIDLFAPGQSINSAWISDPTAQVSMSGTSMAAPHVAGVMALWLQENPALTSVQLHQMIRSNATVDVVADAKSDNAHLLHSIRSTGGEPPPPPPSAPAPPASPPAAPTDLALKLIALNRVDLSWADRSDNEEGFVIERRQGGGTWASLIRVGANTTGYTDQSVLRDESYSYRVRAFNAAGESASSNEATVRVACRTKGKSLNCH
jgi:subtilisin family serine protease